MAEITDKLQELEVKYKNMDIEECINRLEEIAQTMNGTDITLRDALDLYAESVVIVKKAREMIQNSEMEIKHLKKYEEGYSLEDLV